MNSEVELENIINTIHQSQKIIISAHISPDGDAIGSCLAMYLGLKQLKKEVSIIMDEYASCFSFLPGINEINQPINKKYDLLIVLDCASKERLYNPENISEKCNKSISIDHHGSNTFFAKYNYIEPESPAVCKTLVKVFKKLNITITKEIGTCLMAGIITDSGGFRYNTTDAETFEFAASMYNLGINISDIYYRTFDVKTIPQFKLTAIATSRLKFYANGKIAVTYITQKDIKKVKALVGDHEGIVNIGRNIDEVEVSIFLREDKDNSYKVSLRSNREVDVSEISKEFDGGGHKRAAGCTMTTSLEEAIKLLVKETSKKL